MKWNNNIFLVVLAVCVFSGVLSAELITIGPGEYFGTTDIENSDELVMTGGWGDSLRVSDTAIANIYATDSGKQIWNLKGGDNSTLNIYGGSINEIELIHANFTEIKGGDIGTLISIQEVYEDGGMGIHIPRTYLYVSEWNYNPTSMILTGEWQDLTPFSIQLEDKYGISTYENLLFIPEPSSLVLLSIACLALRKRRT